MHVLEGDRESAAEISVAACSEGDRSIDEDGVCSETSKNVSRAILKTHGHDDHYQNYGEYQHTLYVERCF